MSRPLFVKRRTLPQVIGYRENEVSCLRLKTFPVSGSFANTGAHSNAVGRQALRVACAVALALVSGGVALAEQSDSATAATTPSQLIIQRIVVEPQNVFTDSEASKSRILRLLNHFHLPTRKYVVRRESLLKTGDVYSPDLAYETERNLRDLAFIYEASVTIDTTDSAGPALHLRTIDRWSLSSGLKVLRRSERNLFQFGLTESNLLGFGHRVGVTYTISKPDPSYVRLEYKNPRLFGSFNEFGIDVVSNPFDRNSRLTVQRRYLHQADALSYRLSYLSFRLRDIDVTATGDTAATFFQDGERVEGFVAARAGDFHRKLTATVRYRYISGQIQDQTAFNGYTFDGAGKIVPPALPTPSDTFTVPIDSVLHEMTLSLSASRFDFYRESRIKYQKRVEDITIVNGVAFGFGQGRDRTLNNHLYSIWSASLSYGARVSDFVFAGGTRRVGWLKSGREIRTALQSSLIGYYNRLPWVTLAGRARFGYDRRREDPNPLSVDGGSGVRGYPANFVTGNKILVGNLESRLITGVRALTARLGFAIHFDFGTAWSSGDKLRLDSFIWSAGPGLRIDMGQVGTVRVDLSYVRSLDSWQVSAATGQFFDLNPGK